MLLRGSDDDDAVMFWFPISVGMCYIKDVVVWDGMGKFVRVRPMRETGISRASMMCEQNYPRARP